MKVLALILLLVISVNAKPSKRQVDILIETERIIHDLGQFDLVWNSATRNRLSDEKIKSVNLRINDLRQNLEMFRYYVRNAQSTDEMNLTQDRLLHVIFCLKELFYYFDLVKFDDKLLQLQLRSMDLSLHRITALYTRSSMMKTMRNLKKDSVLDKPRNDAFLNAQSAYVEIERYNKLKLRTIR